jgi:hypothetical protein
MALLDLQGMTVGRRATGEQWGGPSNLSLTGCDNPSGLSIILCDVFGH